MQLGSELRRIRKIKSQTLADVSASTGMSISYLSLIERDKTLPSIEMLNSLARYYGTTLHHLLPQDEAGDVEPSIHRPGFSDFLKIMGDSVDSKLQDLMLRLDNQARHPARTKDDWMRYYYNIDAIINYTPT